MRFAKQSLCRGVTWRDGEFLDSSSTDSTIYATPFPSPPLAEPGNQVALHIVRDSPGLFNIETPWHVDVFEHLLAAPPNRPLRVSLPQSTLGFWPFADTSPHISSNPGVVPKHKMVAKGLALVALQRDKEIEARRFSQTFPALLPGMQTSAIGVVLKPQCEKSRP